MNLFLTTLFHFKSVFLTLFCSIIGAFIGSFLNVVIYRLPKIMEQQWRAQSHRENFPKESFKIITARSQCSHCGHVFGLVQKIPLLGYFLLRGKCQYCKNRISVRYPLVELLSSLIIAFICWHFGLSVFALMVSIFGLALMTLAFIDLETELLPDVITLPLLWIGLLFNLYGGLTDLPSAVIGAAVGYLSLWLIYWLFKLITFKEGMGHGDFKLLATIGAWFGWQLLPIVVLLSSVLASIIGIAMVVFIKHDREMPIPFGPYLVIAAMGTLFFSRALIEVLY